MLRPCLVIFTALTIVTGVIYPLAITGVAQLAFPDQAAGSLLRDDEQVVGSRLIAQPASSPDLFWPRPSAVAWNATASGGANLAPVAEAQRAAWAASAATWRAAGIAGTLPADLVTASGSGLDPHLTPAALLAQVPRVAAARDLPEARLRALIAARTEPPLFGIFGPPRVNVLELNRALRTIEHGGP
jgi:K+-transporting ATPase ATPase C chain